MEKPRNKNVYRILVFDQVHTVNVWEDTNPASVDDMVTWRVVPRAWCDKSGTAHLDMTVALEDASSKAA